MAAVEEKDATAHSPFHFPERTPGLVRKAVTRPATVALLFALAALFYGKECLTARNAENTRVSEHALMPGIVLPQFNKQADGLRFLKGARSAQDKHGLPGVAEFVIGELRGHGIHATDHHWRHHGLFQNVTGHSAVGVVRAVRATGAESMAVAVELRDLRAVAMAMALAVHAREHSYWARDIIFIFVDGGALGMNAWLADYFGVAEEKEYGSSMGAHGGSRGAYMIGAVVLEAKTYLDGKHTTHILLSGLNGQLPNLDLFNTVARIGARGHMQMNVMIYPEQAEKLRINPYLTPYRFLLTQAFTAVEGVHSVFGQYGVQALTVRVGGSGADSPSSERFIELILRSLNNLHERFHQSYFLYILASPSHFISIAYFSPLVAILLAPLLVCALHEWYRLPQGGLHLPAALPLLFLVGLGEYLALPQLVRALSLDEGATASLLLGIIFVPVGFFMPLDTRSAGSFRFLLLLAVALGVASLALLNFGLGLATAATVLPPLVATTAFRSRSRWSSLFRSLLLFFFHPLCIFLAGYLAWQSVISRITVDESTIQWAVTHRALELLHETLSRLLKEDSLYGAWLLRLLVAAAVPVWNCLIALASTVEEEEAKPKQKEE